MSTDDASKLFVAGLPDSLTEDELRQVFEAQGATVAQLSLPKDKVTGRRRGFGFVTLASPEEATKAREALDGTEQGGRAISVRPFTTGPARRSEGRPIGAPQSATSGSDRTVYVGNLPFDVTSSEIEKVFVDNGASPVQRVHLPTTPEGRPRGFGFVTLGSAEVAQKAVEALADVEMNGRRLQLSVARSRAERGADRPGSTGSRPGSTGSRPGSTGNPRPRHDGSDSPYRGEPGLRMDPGEAPPQRVDSRRAREKPDAKKRKREKGKRRAERDEFQKRERGGAASYMRWDRDRDDE